MPYGRQRISIQDLPPFDRVRHTLAEITELITKEEVRPRAYIQLAGYENNYPDKNNNREEQELAAVGLLYDDLRADRGPRTGALFRLCQALSVGRKIAMGLPAAISYKQVANTSQLDKSNPTRTQGTLVNIGTSNEPVYLIKSIQDKNHVKDVTGNKGRPIIDATHHSNDCICPLHTAINNVESLSPARICVPQDLRKQYVEHPSLPSATNMILIGKHYPSTSQTYYSSIADTGTILPRLIRRQPVPNITRQYPIIKEPMYSNIAVMAYPPVMRALSAQMSRSEFSQFTKHYNTSVPSSTPTDENIYRFPKIPTRTTNLDIAALGQHDSSYDDVLANESLVAPFHGRQECAYCKEILTVTEPADLLKHLMSEHENLKEATLSCPACPNITLLSSKDYAVHFRTEHAEHTSLMLVLTETSIHARMQQAMILSLYLTMAADSKGQLKTEENRPEFYASSIGGYTLGEPEILFDAIVHHQVKTVPESHQKTIQEIPHGVIISHTEDLEVESIRKFVKYQSTPLTEEELRNEEEDDEKREEHYQMVRHKLNRTSHTSQKMNRSQSAGRTRTRDRSASPPAYNPRVRYQSHEESSPEPENVYDNNRPYTHHSSSNPRSRLNNNASTDNISRKNPTRRSSRYN